MPKSWWDRSTGEIQDPAENIKKMKKKKKKHASIINQIGNGQVPESILEAKWKLFDGNVPTLSPPNDT